MEDEVSQAVEADLPRLRPTLGLTAGASAPEVLVREIIDALALHFDLDEQQVTTAEEKITFKLPRELAGAAI